MTLAAFHRPTPASARAAPRPIRHQFTVADLMRMVDEGIVAGRVELIHGELIDMPAHGNAHSVSITDLVKAILPHWDDPCFLRIQSTQRFTSTFAPEPDLALLEEKPVDGAAIDPIPSLVIEVSDTTLDYDLGPKRLDYALMGVPEYWVVNLRRRRILVFRRPDAGATTAADAWGEEAVYGVGDSLAPLAAPAMRIVVANVIPAAGAIP